MTNYLSVYLVIANKIRTRKYETNVLVFFTVNFYSVGVLLAVWEWFHSNKINNCFNAILVLFCVINCNFTQLLKTKQKKSNVSNLKWTKHHRPVTPFLSFLALTYWRFWHLSFIWGQFFRICIKTRTNKEIKIQNKCSCLFKLLNKNDSNYYIMKTPHSWCYLWGKCRGAPELVDWLVSSRPPDLQWGCSWASCVSDSTVSKNAGWL